MPVDDARRVVERARTAGVFPAAAVEVGSSAARLWTEAFGTGLDTPFDLASLTKVVATTTVIMELVRTSALGIEAVSTAFDEWRGGDREAATVRDLLEHASGLPARARRPAVGRREFEHEIYHPLSTRRPDDDRSTAISGSTCSDSSPPIAAVRHSDPSAAHSSM